MSTLDLAVLTLLTGVFGAAVAIGMLFIFGIVDEWHRFDRAERAANCGAVAVAFAIAMLCVWLIGTMLEATGQLH